MDCYPHGAATHVGLIRKRNEDAYLVNKNKPVKLFAVADGLGGHSGGHVASKLALEAIESFELDPEFLEENIQEAVENANLKVLHAAAHKPELQGMGTTMTIAAVHGNSGTIAHVGDSRAYLYRNGRLKQLTSDHTLVGELMRKGRLEAEEEMNHPQSHVLLQAIGLESRLDVEIVPVHLEDGDELLLCTDGLTGLIKDNELLKMLSAPGEPQEKAEKLMKEANARGGHDNTTVLIVSYRTGEG